MNLKVVKNLSFALFFLYFFLVSIKLLEKGIKTLGAEYTDQLFESVSNPFAGLLVGILCTVLVQSSSVTTSTIVGLVGSGVLSLEYAIPMVMGANIGTTVTNTLVSFGHVRREQEFKRAFAASTMHDFFNVIVVIILFPLDLITGFITKMAEDGIRDPEMSRGLGDVYKRQGIFCTKSFDTLFKKFYRYKKEV